MNAAYWLAHGGLLSLLSYPTQYYLTRVALSILGWTQHILGRTLPILGWTLSILG